MVFGGPQGHGDRLSACIDQALQFRVHQRQMAAQALKAGRQFAASALSGRELQSSRGFGRVGCSEVCHGAFYAVSLVLDAFQIVSGKCVVDDAELPRIVTEKKTREFSQELFVAANAFQRQIKVGCRSAPGARSFVALA